MNNSLTRNFWRDAFALRGSVTPKVVPDVLAFGLIAAGICAAAGQFERWSQHRIGLEIAPHEYVGAALGLLLILRTNAGYDRWWEARKLWGGIVNQSRNLAISGLAYGPSDRNWREQFLRWTAAFPHVARTSLRQQPPSPEVVSLLGEAAARHLAESDHPPSAVAKRLATLLRTACETQTLDRLAFLQIDKERAQLIDHIGACERILKTPLALVYSIKIRRFLAIFLISLPFALQHRLQAEWQVPLLTMLVAYPLLSLDRIGAELQNPFLQSNLSHLPLDEISATIERNILALLEDAESETLDPSVQERAEANGEPVAGPA